MKIFRSLCFCVALSSSNAHAIVLGNVDLDNTYSSVGYVAGLTSLGTVVALDPFWVLTAAHVVDGGIALLVMGDPNTGNEGAYFFFEEIIIHENYVSGETHDDLALIHLSAADPINPALVDASFATLSNVDLGTGLPATATLTGYGLTDVEGSLDPNEPLLRRYGQADTIGSGMDVGTQDCSHASLLCTYDTTGGAPGDSGGAMWVDYGGEQFVAAIMSYIFDDNGDWDDGYWTAGTSTAYYEDWIKFYVPTAMFGPSPIPLSPAAWLFVSALTALAFAARKRHPAHA